MSLARDSFIMTKRNVLRLKRTPQVLVFSTIQPVLFVVLFNSVFGGSIIAPGFENYIDFLIPGVMVQTALFASINTGVGMAEDLEKGTVNRFKSLPISAVSVLFGRTLADSCRSLLVMTVVTLTGFVFGFRPTNGPFLFVLGVLLAVVFAHSFQWAFVYMALRLSSVEAVQAASFAPTFPLVFAASTFAPVDNMPQWMRVFADNQPVTAAVDTLRALFYGGDVWGNGWKAMLWIAGIYTFFVVLSALRFRKK